MIIDRIKAFFFNPIEKKAKKESDADVVRSLIDELQKTKRTSYTVRKQIAAELQQQKLREAISYSQQAPWYYYYELLEMLRQVELDGHLKAVMNQRINSALSESWTVTGKNADIFKQKWFLDYMRIAIESVFWGFSVASITEEKGKIKIAKIDRSYINPEFQTFLTSPNVRNSAGIPLDSFSDAQFIKHDADEVCLLAVAARYTIWKNFSASDWSRYSERFGMPIIIAKTETTNQSELNEMAKMLTNMGANGWAILDKRDDFTLAEASKTDAHNVYLEFIRLLNEELSKIIVGQTMTTDNGSSQSQANVHERVLEFYTLSDMTFLQFVINDQLLPFLEKKGLISGAHQFAFDSLKKTEKPIEKPAKQPAQKNIENFTKASATAARTRQKSLKSDFKRAIEKAAKSIYDAGELILSVELMEELTLLTYNQLSKPYNKYAKAYEPDPDLIAAILDNLFVFSGFKTAAELQAIAALIIDDEGMIRPYNEFLQEVMLLNANYNAQYLQAEYQTAVATAQNIARWQKFEAQKADYDLVFDAVNDARVRPEHLALDGVVFAVDDSFWNTYAPPLGWRCRCMLRQVPKGTAGNPLPSTMPVISPVFQNNAAKTGVVFPQSHPYFALQDADNIRRVIGEL